MNIVITHCYSDSNKGDLGMLLGTINELKRLRPDANITVQSMYSESHNKFAYHTRFVRSLGVHVEEGILPAPYVDEREPSPARNFVALLRVIRDFFCLQLLWIHPSLGRIVRRQQAKAFRSLKSADLVIAKAGHYLYNDQGGLRASLYIWRLLTGISVPVRLGKPTILLGHSIGPIYGRRARRLARAVLTRCASVVVREKRTREVLADLGVVENVQLAPDLAFLTDPTPPKIPAFFAEHEGWIAVSINNWMFPESDDPEQQKTRYVNAVLETLREAYGRWQLRPVFFLQEFVQQHGSSDIHLVEEMLRSLRDQNVPAEMIEDDFWPGELAHLYSYCQLALATRFHTCIYAAMTGTPVIAIRYQGYKTEGVMADAGMERFVHDIDNVESACLLADIETILRDRDAYSKQISGYAVSARQELSEKIGGLLPGTRL
jgi:polysaccharide pyruvyl transferase WcaK-like protein